MNITEANAVITILRNAMGLPVVTSGSGADPALVVLEAARFLAERSRLALGTGLTASDIDENWPGPGTVATAAQLAACCPDCDVPTGAPHDNGCDIARCLQTGGQRLTCHEDHDHGSDVWTGTLPGETPGSSKPQMPKGPFADWPRIHVDTSDGSPFAHALRAAGFAADAWTFGPEGPYKNPQPPADVTRGHLREGILHLLELGFVDLDPERMAGAEWVPGSRQDCRPSEDINS